MPPRSAPPRSGLMLLALPLLAVAPGARAQSDATCKAGEACAGRERKHYWPGPHGRPESYGTSPYAGPFDLTANLKWKWHHPDGPWADMPLAAVIDDEKNTYVSTDRGIWKLSPEGKALWSWTPSVLPLPGMNRHPDNLIPNGPALEGDLLFINDILGRFWALDLETGRERWTARPAKAGCTDTGFVTARKGVVMAATDPPEGTFDRCQMVRALNASTGETLWEYKADDGVWDLMVQYDEEDTIYFQDLSGKVYRNWLSNGTNIWKNGGSAGSWTDGTQFLGNDGIVYGVNTNNCGGPDCHGTLAAYDAADGSFLWKQDTPRPPNSSPTVGKLGKGDRLSVIIPIGQQPSCLSAATIWWMMFPLTQYLPGVLQWFWFIFLHKLSVWLGDGQQRLWRLPDLPTDVMAFDAKTGAPQWTWKGPTYHRFQCPGDERWYLTRQGRQTRAASCPTPWSAPRIGADGTIYVGNQNGHFFAIKDINGDGSIDPDREVHDFDCGAEFSSAGSAHAPGLVVIASGDVVYAFGS